MVPSTGSTEHDSRKRCLLPGRGPRRWPALPGAHPHLPAAKGAAGCGLRGDGALRPAPARYGGSSRRDHRTACSESPQGSDEEGPRRCPDPAGALLDTLTMDGWTN